MSPTQATDVTGQIPPLSSAQWIPPRMVCAQIFRVLFHHGDGESRKTWIAEVKHAGSRPVNSHRHLHMDMFRPFPGPLH